MLKFGAESYVFQVVIQKFKFKKFRTKILPVVLYGCEIRALILREKPRLRVYMKRVLGMCSDTV